MKLDENLGTSHQRFLQSVGYDVDRVLDEELGGAADSQVWKIVQREGRFFVTMDLDFSDLRRFRPGSHAGLLVVRAREPGPRAALSILMRVLEERPLESMARCFAVADERRTRIFAPPSNGK